MGMKSSSFVCAACLLLSFAPTMSEAKSSKHKHWRDGGYQDSYRSAKRSYAKNELYSDNYETHRSFLDSGVMVPEWKGHAVIQQMTLHNRQSLQVTSPGVLWRESGLPGYHEADNGLNSFSWSLD